MQCNIRLIPEHPADTAATIDPLTFA